MALIKCPECGCNVSDRATACPQCAYPISDYVKDRQEKRMMSESGYTEEIARLMKKVKPVVYKVPEPRARVCIKCGKSFSYCSDPSDEGHGKPSCSCSFKGFPYPGVEVDYPQQQATTIFSERYIFEQCVVPMNIGDCNSEEYKENEQEILNTVDYTAVLPYVLAGKEYPKSLLVRPEPEPPSEEWYGRTSGTPSSERIAHAEAAEKEESHVPTCPICGSSNLIKISAVKKAAKISVFGFFGMGDSGKTWKCGDCGSKF